MQCFCLRFNFCAASSCTLVTIALGFGKHLLHDRVFSCLSDMLFNQTFMSSKKEEGIIGFCLVGTNVSTFAMKPSLSKTKSTNLFYTIYPRLAIYSITDEKKN